MASSPGCIQQAAAIPYRDGRVCLVTSSSGKRWVIPKGCMEPGKTAGEVALQEAWEEAGLVGVLQPELAGTYRYEKYGNQYLVIVFRLQVTEASDDWPERSLRQRIWLTPVEAMDRIDDRGLPELIRATVEEYAEARD